MSLFYPTGKGVLNAPFLSSNSDLRNLTSEIPTSEHKWNAASGFKPLGHIVWRLFLKQ